MPIGTSAINCSFVASASSASSSSSASSGRSARGVDSRHQRSRRGGTPRAMTRRSPGISFSTPRHKVALPGT
jgi:hypothetical protein